MERKYVVSYHVFGSTNNAVVYFLSDGLHIKVFDSVVDAQSDIKNLSKCGHTDVKCVPVVQCGAGIYRIDNQQWIEEVTLNG